MIPDYQALMLPLLRFYEDGELKRVSEIESILAHEFSLTDEERETLLPSGKQRTFLNRIGWARTYLGKAGLLESPVRSKWQITARGKDVLQKNLKKIDVAYLEQFSEFNDFQSPKKIPDGQQVERVNLAAQSQTPEESIAYGYSQLRQALIQDLLQQVKRCSPSFFEQLVVDLLVKMGYGGTARDAAQVVGRSGDGGIDGIVKEDKLGLDVIYLQAKRWEGVVGRPEIQKFVGALAGHGARKGVFITTSNFTNEALEYAQNPVNNIKIVLIDGLQLSELMSDHNLGVATAQTIEVKRLDSDYFAEAE
jgi:restriction system protein